MLLSHSVQMCQMRTKGKVRKTPIYAEGSTGKTIIAILSDIMNTIFLRQSIMTKKEIALTFFCNDSLLHLSTICPLHGLFMLTSGWILVCKTRTTEARDKSHLLHQVAEGSYIVTPPPACFILRNPQRVLNKWCYFSE